MWSCKVTVLLSWFGSSVSEAAIKAVLLKRRSLFAGFVTGVETIIIVALSPTARLGTVQKPQDTAPSSQDDETKLSGSGRGSPKPTFVAGSGPRLVTVMVKVM